jgi:hypothetical protein
MKFLPYKSLFNRLLARFTVRGETFQGMKKHSGIEEAI